LFTLIARGGTKCAGHYDAALSKKESPAFRRDFPYSLSSVSELAAALVLAARILLLLSGLLATALLLPGLLARVLPGLLARGLILLARILILVRHRDLPG
jgi:hypothetical protein